LKLDGKYDVPESGLKLRTRGENAGWYEVWYPDFDMDPRNDQFGDVVDWSYGRVSFTLKKDAATVLELLKGRWGHKEFNKYYIKSGNRYYLLFYYKLKKKN
jgi:hypothetical protein